MNKGGFTSETQRLREASEGEPEFVLGGSASKKKPGRPVGIPRQGLYGDGIKTVPVRVPIEWAETIPHIIRDFPEIIDDWKSRSKSTRDWTQANKLIGELELYFEGLLLCQKE